jgi:hypothetical protein
MGKGKKRKADQDARAKGSSTPNADAMPSDTKRREIGQKHHETTKIIEPGHDELSSSSDDEFPDVSGTFLRLYSPKS